MVMRKSVVPTTTAASAPSGLAKAEALREMRERVRQEVMAEVLEDFEEQPAPAVKPKKRRRYCFPKTRRYYGLCYWKDMHEAVVDGDGLSIIKQMAKAELRDRREVEALGGVERAEQFSEDETKGFVGSAVTKANAYDSEGRTPLALAVKQEREDVVDLVLSFQCNPSKPDGASGLSPLMHAILAELPGVALRLVDEDADVEYATSAGTTALMLACLKDDVDVVELLVERQADLDARDKHGWTALHYAAIGGHVEPAIQLLKAGAAKNKKDRRGFTAKDFAKFMRIKAATFERQQAEDDARSAFATESGLRGHLLLQKKKDPLLLAVESLPTCCPDGMDPAAYGEVEACIENFKAKLVG